jgi:WD40 repeat protein
MEGPYLHLWDGCDLTRNRRTVAGNRRTKHFTDLAFHTSGKFLAATSNDQTVKLFDTMTWEVARTFTWDIGRMRSVAFSPDGTLAAAGGDTGQVVVWDVDV